MHPATEDERMMMAESDEEDGEPMVRPAMVVSGTSIATAGTVRIGELRAGCRRLHVSSPVTDQTIRELRRFVSLAEERGAEQVLVALQSDGDALPVSEVEHLSVALGDLAIPVHVVPTER